MDKHIVLSRERGKVHQIMENEKELTPKMISKMKWRTRLNPDIEYYILRIPEEIREDIKGCLTVDHFIGALNEYPSLLNKSKLIERI